MIFVYHSEEMWYGLSHTFAQTLAECCMGDPKSMGDLTKLGGRQKLTILQLEIWCYKVLVANGKCLKNGRPKALELRGRFTVCS